MRAPQRKDINDAESFTYSLSQPQNFQAGAGDSERIQTSGRATLPEQVLVAHPYFQLTVFSRDGHSHFSQQ